RARGHNFLVECTAVSKGQLFPYVLSFNPGVFRGRITKAREEIQRAQTALKILLV
ncbi:unnamed protein product, partial [Dovyalis caffra]